MTMNPFFEDIVIEMSGQGPTGKTGNSIESIVKTSTDVLTDTYTITFTWGNTSTFEVENGNGIVSITKTGTDVLTDTYTVLFSNETTTTFDVVNGRGISSIAKKSTDVLQDVYEITYNDGTTSDYTVSNGRGITSIEKSGSHDNVDIYTISYNDNTVSTFQVVNGIDGTAATIAVGSTTTGLPGTDALVTNSGTSRDAVFNFVIPRGNTGNGIASIALVGTVGLTKTYRVTYTDGEHFDYQVLDGNGIASIVLYSTSGLNKTYRVTYTNGDHFDYVVSDGNGISSITLLSQSGLVKTYRITYTNGTHFDFSVSDGNGIASIEKTATVGAVDTYTVTFTDPTAEPFSYDVTNGSDTWGAIVGDIADQIDLQTALDTKAPVIVENAQGDLVTFADGADLPVESLSVSVEPVQDLHGYDNPWPAGGGVNKLAPAPSGTVTDNGCTAVSDGNGRYTLSGTASGNANLVFTPSAQYTIQSGDYLHMLNSEANASVVISFTFTDSTTFNPSMTPVNRILSMADHVGKTIASFKYYVSNGQTYSGTVKPMILNTNAVTAFAPYANICPISGWSQVNVPRTGVNLLNDATDSLETLIIDSNSSQRYGHSFAKAGTYAVKSYSDMDITYRYIFARIRYADGSFSSHYPIRNQENSTPAIITITEGQTLIVYDASNNTAELAHQRFSGCSIQVAYQSTQPDTYQPYQGQQLTIPLGQTVYGATLDVGAGTLRVDKAMVDLGTLTWYYDTVVGGYFETDPDAIENIKSYGVGELPDIICSMLETKFGYYVYTTGIGIGQRATRLRAMYPGAGTDPVAFKASLSGVQLVYTLAEPFEVILTPAILRTLSGYNAIWADAGAVDVSYRADTKLFVEKSIAEANATTRKMIADTANGNLAPKSLDSGDLIIVGEELRKCTANIGLGNAITDSNSTVANLADVIKALQ